MKHFPSHLKMTLLSICWLLMSSEGLLGQSKDPGIKWKESVQLEWSDFKARPDTNVLGFALTSYELKIIPQDVKVDENKNVLNYQDLTVKAFFLKDKSWVYKKTPELLDHERLHFDIAALFARKMRKAFDELIQKGIADFDAYQETYKKYWRECAKMQRKYDRETRHGRDMTANREWSQKVEALLQG